MSGNVYQDIFLFVAFAAPMFILLAGLSFADIFAMTIVRLVKAASANVKWR